MTSRQIQDHILQRRELVYRNRLLMRQAVAVEPKVRSVFDGSFAGNVFLSVGSKPMSEFIKRGCHPQVYSLDALSHSNSWHGQFLAKDSGMGTILTFDIKKMDKSVLHSSTAAYCNSVADCFEEEEEGGLSRFGYSVASHTLLRKTSVETPWKEVYAYSVRGRQTNDRAELSAIIQAISQSHPVKIFTDSMFSISILTQILDGSSLRDHINDTNADLIQELIHATTGRTWTHISIHHARSHQDMQLTSA